MITDKELADKFVAIAKQVVTERGGDPDDVTLDDADEDEIGAMAEALRRLIVEFGGTTL